MKRLYLCAFLAVLLLAALAAACVPVRTEVTSIAVSELCESTDPSLAAAGAAWRDAVDSRTDFSAWYQDVYIADNTYLISGTETVYIIPWLTAEVADVPTAGNSDWSFQLYLSVLVEGSDGTVRESTAYQVPENTFAVEADPNTALLNPQIETAPGNCILVSPNAADWRPSEPYTAAFRASVRDSAEGPNAPCTAVCRWSGSVSPWPAALFAEPMDFCLNMALPYRNNLT